MKRNLLITIFLCLVLKMVARIEEEAVVIMGLLEIILITSVPRNVVSFCLVKDREVIIIKASNFGPGLSYVVKKGITNSF